MTCKSVLYWYNAVEGSSFGWKMLEQALEVSCPSGNACSRCHYCICFAPLADDSLNVCLLRDGCCKRQPPPLAVARIRCAMTYGSPVAITLNFPETNQGSTLLILIVLQCELETFEQRASRQGMEVL